MIPLLCKLEKYIVQTQEMPRTYLDVSADKDLLAACVLSPHVLTWRTFSRNSTQQFPSSEEVVHIVKQHISSLMTDIPEIHVKLKIKHAYS